MMQVKQKIILTLTVLGMVFFIECGGSVSGTGSESASTQLSTAPTPTWGSLTVDVATNTESSQNTANGLMALSVERNDGRRRVPISDDQIEISEIRLTIRDVRFESSENRLAQSRLNGPFIVNLVQEGKIVDETYPEMGALRAISTNYDEVSFRLDRLDPNQIPANTTDEVLLDDTIIGHSLVVEGEFKERDIDINDDGEFDSLIPFRFISDSTEKIKVTGNTKFAVLQESNNYLFITFRIQRWFERSLSELQEISPHAYDFDNDLVVIYDDGEEGNIFRDLSSIMEESIHNSFGYAPSDDDRFDFEEDLYHEEEDDFEIGSQREIDEDDDICREENDDDWFDDCLNEKESCIDECFHPERCWNDAITEEDFRHCEDRALECSRACWKN